MFGAAGSRVGTLWSRFQATSVWRGWKRYSSARGNLLAGGIAYFAFFSIFPAVALGFTVFGLVLRNQPQLLDNIRDYLNDALPGFVKQSPDDPNGVISLEVPTGRTLSTTGLIGFVVLLWAGLGWLSALRDGVRAVFGVSGGPGNLVISKLRDLGVLVVLAVGIVVSASVTVVAGSLTERAADVVGLTNQQWMLTFVGVVVGALLDTVLMLVVLRVLSGVEVPWRGLRNGAVFGGVGLTLLKVFGTKLVEHTTDNPIFASITVVVGLLLWLQLISRIMLISAAWAANDLDAAEAHLPTVP